MSYGIRIECWSDYACFTRPEMKVERVSYDIMTPSAARGLVEAIFWHPGLRYVIDEIGLMSPIQFTNVRRNEIKSKLSGSLVLKHAKSGQPIEIETSKEIVQRASTILKQVHYYISLHFEMTDKANPGDNPGKFKEMLTRRARKGQCYHQPYLGCREFPAYFRLVEDGEEPVLCDVTKDLGYMLYDMDYRDPENITPLFFRARLDHGVMSLRDCEVVR